MPIYTFIANYKGGTYVFQVAAPDITAAIFLWAKNLNVKAIPRLNENSRKKILKKVRRNEAEESLGHVPIDGLHNVWFFDVWVKGKLMDVNFVQTEST